MDHALPKWFDLDGRLAGLQELPVLLQFRPVNFRPSLDEPLLRPWQAAAETLDCVDREHSCLVLVLRVKVRAVMLTASFNEHPDHDPEEPREFGHGRTLASSELPCGPRLARPFELQQGFTVARFDQVELPWDIQHDARFVFLYPRNASFGYTLGIDPVLGRADVIVDGPAYRGRPCKARRVTAYGTDVDARIILKL